MSADDERSILLSIVDRIEVGKATNLDTHNYDPDRFKVVFRYEAIYKIANAWKTADGRWRLPMILFDAKAGQPIQRAS